MPQASENNGSPKIPMFQHIGTRDGTLLQDGKMVNCLKEITANGEAIVKRPGTVLVRQLPAGASQGQFLLNGNPYAIVNDTIYSVATGLPTAIPGVTMTNQQYTALSDVPFNTTVFKSVSGAWIFNGLTLTVTKITDANYPLNTVGGIAYLDGVYYVMDINGAVHGSALQDPTTWPALNFVAADATLGQGAGIVRHLNYIVAFYTHGTQFYYDAGNSPGIALSPVGNASWITGCLQAQTIVEMADTTFFVSKNHQYGRGVSIFNGLSLVKISNAYIERILNRSNFLFSYAFGIKPKGHTLYVLTMADINTTLVYDSVMQDWHVWTSNVNGIEQYFVGLNYLGTGTQDLLQEINTGAIVQMSPTVYTDNSGPINVLVRTAPYDWATLRRKRFEACFLLADTVASTVSVRYSDDDYNTYSAYRPIDLSSVRKMLQRCGMSRRRSWDILHTDNTPLKLYQMELQMKVMEL